MNGKPVFRVPIKTAINLKSGFKEKLLCDGPTFALGDACAYECAFCYVPAMIDKLDRVQAVLKSSGLKHEDVVILREALVETVRDQLLHPNGKPKWKTADDRRVIYASPLDDVAANMDLVRATVEVCALILEHTNWHIRLLSKSNLLPFVPQLLADRAMTAPHPVGFGVMDVKERMVFGVSTGTLDDRVARVFEKGTPIVSKRIAALHKLQDGGWRTFGMVCPSLPMRSAKDYAAFAQRAAELLRYDRCEHVWAEVINLRGESFTRTVGALRQGGCLEEAELLEWVSANPTDWELYNRATFEAHAAVCAQWVGKLRYLVYVDDSNRRHWQGQIAKGAVLL